MCIKKSTSPSVIGKFCNELGLQSYMDLQVCAANIKLPNLLTYLMYIACCYVHAMINMCQPASGITSLYCQHMFIIGDISTVRVKEQPQMRLDAVCNAAPCFVVCEMMLSTMQHSICNSTKYCFWLLQEAAKAKDAAKRAREAEVFILNPQGPPTTHTVPKPFILHDTANQVNALSLKEEFQMGHLLALAVQFWLLHVAMLGAALNNPNSPPLPHLNPFWGPGRHWFIQDLP